MALRTPVGTGGADDRPARFEDLWADRDVLHGYCRKIVGDTALAEDMVQEAFTEAFVNLDTLERRSSFLPWLATVAKRRGLNELRRYHYSTPVEMIPESPDHVEVDPADVAATRDQVQRLRAALTMLTPRERQLLMRQVNHGKSIGELAEEEQSSPASVRSVLLRARAKLRAQMGEGMAWLLLPVTSAADWARRRLTAFSTRAAEGVQLSGAAYQIGEVVAAAVVATSIVGGPAALGASGPVFGPAMFENAPLLTYSADAPETDEAVPVDAPRRATTLEDADPVTANDVGPEPTGGSTSEAPPDPPDGPGNHEFTPPTPPTPNIPNPPPPPVTEDPIQDPEDVHFSHLAAVPTGGSPSAKPEVFAIGRSVKNCAPGCTVLLHSADGGATWTRKAATGLGDAISLLLAPAYPADPRMYAMGTSGLRLSVDGGASFHPVNEPYQGTAAMSPLFSEGDERILVGSSPPWVYDARTDSHSPFTGAPMTSSENHFAFAPDYAASRLLFAGTAVEGPPGAQRAVVYRCTQDRCEDGSMLQGLRTAPHIVPSSGFAENGVVLAWSENDLARSVDRGRTFQTVALPSRAPINALVDDAGRSYAAVGKHTSDASGVLVSSDGGATWVVRGQGTALEQGTRAILAFDGRVIAAPLGDARGLLCSSDGGETWSSRCR